MIRIMAYHHSKMISSETGFLSLNCCLFVSGPSDEPQDHGWWTRFAAVSQFFPFQAISLDAKYNLTGVSITMAYCTQRDGISYNIYAVVVLQYLTSPTEEELASLSGRQVQMERWSYQPSKHTNCFYVFFSNVLIRSYFLLYYYLYISKPVLLEFYFSKISYQS